MDKENKKNYIMENYPQNRANVDILGQSAKGNSLLDAAQNANYVFISVMGPHANEKEDDIYERKYNDIVGCGESFWVSGIDEKFIKECREKLHGADGYVILVEASSNGNSAANTTGDKKATEYSINKEKWDSINANISEVTGNLHKGGIPAYYFDDIELFENKEAPIILYHEIDLNYYSECNNQQEAIRFRQGYSNVFAKRIAAPLPRGMQSHKRKIVAVLRLIPPYVVWVR